MQSLSRPELYNEFLNFVNEHTEKERSELNRRVISVVLWCFLIPLFVVVAGMVLVGIGMIGAESRSYFDWIFVAFPVVYSANFLFKEVVVGLPIFSRGKGLSRTLEGAKEASEWRTKTSKELTARIACAEEDWDWIAQSLAIDLKAMRFRARFLTALAGAVFFLILMGLDLLGTPSSLQVPFDPVQFQVWIENLLSSVTQLVGLGLFLLLLHLAGSQIFQSIERYHDCLRLK